MIVAASVFTVINGGDYTSILYDGTQSAVELCISLAGIMALWGGLMEIAERSGITAVFSRLLSPIIHLIFPDIAEKPQVKRAVSMNITANILGLGNAATPLGIEAMKRLSAENGNSDTASRAMMTFVVVNTASVQLIPVTTAALRAKFGSAAPMSILPAVLMASALSLLVGLTVDRLAVSFKGRKI